MPSTLPCRAGALCPDVPGNTHKAGIGEDSPPELRVQWKVPRDPWEAEEKIHTAGKKLGRHPATFLLNYMKRILPPGSVKGNYTSTPMQISPALQSLQHP